jgi:FMN phosphatase YigB (HAD superfamily)
LPTNPLHPANGGSESHEFMLAAAAESKHKVPFDRVISVAEAKSFKPHVASYTTAAELLRARANVVGDDDRTNSPMPKAWF